MVGGGIFHDAHSQHTNTLNQRTAQPAFPAALPLLLLTLAGLFVTGCDSGDKPQVKTDFDPKVNFAQYHTFAFQIGKIVSVAGAKDPNNTLVDNRIRDAVNSQLPSKGLQAVSQDPDLVATYIAGAQSKQQIEDLGPSPYASPYFGGPFYLRSGGPM